MYDKILKFCFSYRNGGEIVKTKIVLILLCFIYLFGLTGCTNRSEGAINFSSSYVDLEVVENTNDGRILVDRNTGVLYLWYKDRDVYGQTLTPLYNADGTLKNISDFDK